MTRSPNWQNFVGFAPDGKSLVFTDQNGETGSDIWFSELRSKLR